MKMLQIRDQVSLTRRCHVDICRHLVALLLFCRCSPIASIRVTLRMLLTSEGGTVEVWNGNWDPLQLPTKPTVPLFDVHLDCIRPFNAVVLSHGWIGGLFHAFSASPHPTCPLSNCCYETNKNHDLSTPVAAQLADWLSFCMSVWLSLYLSVHHHLSEHHHHHLFRLRFIDSSTTAEQGQTVDWFRPEWIVHWSMSMS